jgi:Zn-dependent peptidase ImmA (M78 family)
VIHSDTQSFPDDIPRLLEALGESQVPVNLSRIAHLLNARIYTASLEGPSEGVSAVYPDRLEIFVSEHLSPEWKRLVVAKELAHFLLQRNASENLNIPEHTLFDLASKLLMPEKQVEAAWSASGDEHALANFFFVPEIAMHARLATLNLIKA